jgi:hypothetical protein
MLPSSGRQLTSRETRMNDGASAPLREASLISKTELYIVGFLVGSRQKSAQTRCIMLHCTMIQEHRAGVSTVYFYHRFL